MSSGQSALKDRFENGALFSIESCSASIKEFRQVYVLLSLNYTRLLWVPFMDYHGVQVVRT